jgi:hypothetical protein
LSAPGVPPRGCFSRFCGAPLHLIGWRLVFTWPPAPRIAPVVYLDMSGDENQDLARIAACYAGKRDRYPRMQGDIRFARSTPKAWGLFSWSSK